MAWLVGAGMFGGLLLLLALGVPIAFALLGIALAALYATGGGIDALGLVASTWWSSVASLTLTSVPMFMFMGAIVSASGMGARLYAALAKILDGVPGGLVVATTVACSVMAAVSGSSVATAAAIGGFAIAEMRRHGVPPAQACGAVAGGGTLGILLPPSIPLIVYSVIAQQSIGRLFLATLTVPGLIMVGAFAAFQVTALRRCAARASPIAAIDGAREPRGARHRVQGRRAVRAADRHHPRLAVPRPGDAAGGRVAGHRRQPGAGRAGLPRPHLAQVRRDPGHHRAQQHRLILSGDRRRDRVRLRDDGQPGGDHAHPGAVADAHIAPWQLFVCA